MNICVITSLYPVFGRNDIKTDTQAIHLILKYLTKNNSVHVFNISRVSPCSFFKSIFNSKDNLENYYNYSIDGIEATLLRYRAFPKQKVLTKRQITIVRKIITKVLKEKNFVPDVFVVHVPSSFANILSDFSCNTKCVAVLHRTDINVITAIPKLSKTLNNQYDLILSRSHSIKRMAQDLGINVDERIVFSGIPKEYIDPSFVHRFNNLKEQINILYVGKLIKRKHPEYLISLCRDLNKKGINAHVHIIGDGPLKGRLDSLVGKCEYKEKIKMTRVVKRVQVQEYMKSSDVFVLPSVNETLGLVYLEAMAAGCLTIGVIDEGIDGIIKDKNNGYLVESNNYNSLLDCLLLIIKQDCTIIQKISNKALETAKRTSEEVASKNYVALLSE